MEVLIIVAIVCLVVAGIIYSAMAAAKRRKELQEWASSKGLRFSEAKDRVFDDRYPEFKMLRRGSSRYAHNILSGDWDGRRLQAFDYHYETHSTNSKGQRQTHHHHFSAVILSCDLPLKPLFIRAEGFFDKVTEFFGADDIDFESAEFSRKFFVKAPDRRWAFDVLHARTMQFLLDQPKHTIQFDRNEIIVLSSGRYTPVQYEKAIEIGAGILDGFPDYLVKQLAEEASY